MTDNLIAIWMSFGCIIAGLLGRNIKIKYVRGHRRGFTKVQEERILRGFKLSGTFLICIGIFGVLLGVLNYL